MPKALMLGRFPYTVAWLMLLVLLMLRLPRCNASVAGTVPVGPGVGGYMSRSGCLG